MVETDSHNFFAKNEQYRSHDIIMKSKDQKRPHIVIEFKQGEEVERLKHEALKQIHENKYYAGLEGEVLHKVIALRSRICWTVKACLVGTEDSEEIL